MIPITSQQDEIKKSERTRGGNQAVLGFLMLLWGASWLFWAGFAFIEPPENYSPNDMVQAAILYGQPFTLLGSLLLFFGVRRLGSITIPMLVPEDEKETRALRRKNGHQLIWAGAICSSLGILFLVLAIYNFFIIPITDQNKSDGISSASCAGVGLILGIPMLFIGVNQYLASFS